MRSHVAPRIPWLLLSVLPLLPSCSDSLPDPLRIEAGLLSGTDLPDSKVRVYKGVPYAEPPLEDLRWRPPRPPAPWEGVRQADAFAPACMQHPPDFGPPWTEEYRNTAGISEDCLYLNVWTAARSPGEKRPVMVYVHGGGFVSGSCSGPVKDGTALAEKGVVVVTFNYRVGTLGFLAHQELTAESDREGSGNYGLLDQVAALEWVRRNIGRFGGDPENVTAFGLSAGGVSVALLLRSPLAKGLIHRGIIQSGVGYGSPLVVPPLEVGEAAGEELQDAVGAGSLSDLRALPPEKLAGGGIGWTGPVMDGWVLQPPLEVQDTVPVLIGFSADDIGVNDIYSGVDSPASVEAYEADIRQKDPILADTFLALYPASSEEEVRAVRLAAARDRARVTLDLWTREAAGYRGPAYTYYFDRTFPWSEHPEFGSFHGGELPYVFATLERFDREWEPADVRIADQVSSYWTNFAREGDPNGPGLPDWPPLDSLEGQTMRLGTETGLIPLAPPAREALWRRVLTRLLQSPTRR